MDSNAKLLAAAALLFAMVLVSYVPGFGAGYIIDDDGYVSENPTLKDLAGLQRIWSEPGATGQYYPLVFTTFWIEYQIWGTEPAGYHAVNILLHALNALLLWIVCRRMEIPAAWLVAAVFALHPVHVESVTWVAERKNVLSGLFFLLAVLAYLRYAGWSRGERRAPGRWRFYAAAAVLFGAALLSKTATVSFPAVLLLVAWWKTGRIRWRADVLPLLPLFAMSLALGLITLQVETTSVGASGSLWELSWMEKLLVAGRAVWFYAAKLIWPVGLSFNYERWVIDASAWRQYVYPVTALAVMMWLWAARRRLGRGPLTAVLYFAGTLAPTLGFFTVFFFRYSYVADHFQYLASIGPIALVVGAAAEQASRLPLRARQVGPVAAGVVLVLLGGLTFRQNTAYHSLETLCLDTLRKNPTSWLAHNNLGNIYMKRGQLKDAVEQFELALDSESGYIETHLNLAIALTNQGRFFEAARHARAALELHPEDALGYAALGDVHLRAGRPEEAIRWLREALARNPDVAKTRLGLATALTQAGKPEDAIAHFEAALKLDPDNVTMHANLAIALAQVERFAEAIRHLQEALRLDPDNAALQQNLTLVQQRAREAGR